VALLVPLAREGPLFWVLHKKAHVEECNFNPSSYRMPQRNLRPFGGAAPANT
jgi:hypothetical protein